MRKVALHPSVGVAAVMVLLVSAIGCKKPGNPPREQAQPQFPKAPSAQATASVFSSIRHDLPSGCLIAQGGAAGVLVVREGASTMEREAAERLQSYLYKATGVRLPLLSEAELSDELAQGGEAPPEALYIGSTEALHAEGIDVSTLPEESYGLLRRKGKFFLYGRDAGFGMNTMLRQSRESGGSGAAVERHWSAYRTPATLWAVNTFAEEALGVRWLWPGELGTYVPTKESVSLPAEGHLTKRPLLERRAYMAKWRLVATPEKTPHFLLPLSTQERLQSEARAWLEDHQAGNRSESFYGHSFSHWWERYGATQPELFAQPPDRSIQQPFPLPHRVKLRLANPAVLDVIEEEYRAAGMPATWPVTPNDGSGFDTSPETMAWDKPAHQSKLAIWRAEGELTARYVHFWNAVYERLSKWNPEVKLSVLAYSSYRKPPAAGSVKAKLSLAIVHNFKGQEAYDAWQGWAGEGADMLLRPNWWHVGVHAPYLEPLEQGAYLHFAGEHGMTGFTIDTLMGYWATQGLNYYMVARMVADPHRSPQAVLREYAEAFGPAAPEVQAYLDYWMRESAKVDFAGAASIHSASSNAANARKGEYEIAAKKHGISKSILIGSFRAIPLLYTDARLAEGFRLLEAARKKAAASAGDATLGKQGKQGNLDEPLQRVEFLIAGLQEFRQTRDLLQIGYEIKEKRAVKRLPEFREKAAALRALRTRLTEQHAIWGESVFENELRRKVPTTVEALGELTENMDGM